jgi:hypothetical protein
MSENSHDLNGSALRVFIDPALGFRVGIPKGWLVDTSGQQGTKVILYQPDADQNFRANVNVVLQDLGPLCPDEYLMLSRLQLKQLTGFPRLPTDAPADSRVNAHVFEWMTDRATPPVRVRQMVAFAGPTAITVTATASLDRFENHRAEFGEVFGSFRLPAEV